MMTVLAAYACRVVILVLACGDWSTSCGKESAVEACCVLCGQFWSCGIASCPVGLLVNADLGVTSGKL